MPRRAGANPACLSISANVSSGRLQVCSRAILRTRLICRNYLERFGRNLLRVVVRGLAMEIGLYSANSRGCAMSTASLAFPVRPSEKYRPRNVADFVGLPKAKRVLAKFVARP